MNTDIVSCSNCIFKFYTQIILINSSMMQIITSEVGETSVNFIGYKVSVGRVASHLRFIYPMMTYLGRRLWASGSFQAMYWKWAAKVRLYTKQKPKSFSVHSLVDMGDGQFKWLHADSPKKKFNCWFSGIQHQPTYLVFTRKPSSVNNRKKASICCQGFAEKTIERQQQL